MIHVLRQALGNSYIVNEDCLGKRCLHVSCLTRVWLLGLKKTVDSQVGLKPRSGGAVVVYRPGKCRFARAQRVSWLSPDYTHRPYSNVPQLSSLATMPDEQSGNPPLPTQSQSTSAQTPGPAPSAPAPSQSQPTARKKGTACFRCRSQKTRCDDRQPCSSCSKTGQNCIRPRTLDAERLVMSYHIQPFSAQPLPDSDPSSMEASS